MMPNVLQYPVTMLAILRAGYTVVNVNPLYTPRELEFQLKDSGAEAIVVLENFAHTLAEVIARTSVKHVVVAAMGDMLGLLKGTIVNLVVRHVKKMVPAYSLAGAHSFNPVLAAGRRMTLNNADARRQTTLPSCNIPAAPPAFQKARPCRTATLSPTPCRPMPGCSRH